MQWIIETIAGWLGISPLAAVGLLVVGSMVLSALLRWHRRVREEEYHYLELVGSGHELSAADFADPQGYGERMLAERPPEIQRRARRRERARFPSSEPAARPADAQRRRRTLSWTDLIRRSE